MHPTIFNRYPTAVLLYIGKGPQNKWNYVYVSGQGMQYLKTPRRITRFYRHMHKGRTYATCIAGDVVIFIMRTRMYAGDQQQLHVHFQQLNQSSIPETDYRSRIPAQQRWPYVTLSGHFAPLKRFCKRML